MFADAQAKIWDLKNNYIPELTNSFSQYYSVSDLYLHLLT